MATWVEDIVQALTNLGGKASLSQIYDEIERIRTVALPPTWHASIRGSIERHSSDSEAFTGTDLFKKEGNGYWALNEKPQLSSSAKINQVETRNSIKDNKNMENQDLIFDDGLFVGQEIFKFSVEESFDSITNLFQTIKQYRDYSNPDDATWFEYIHDFFSTLGFNTVKIAPRLIGLHDIGTNEKPKAIVCIVGPKENFTEIAYGIDWKTYLFYASQFHETDWVILTNGLQFNVFNFCEHSEKQKSFKCELDEIIRQGKTDSFFTLYKVLIAITNNKTSLGTDLQKPAQRGERVLVERNFIRKEFWTKLLENPKKKDSPFRNIKSPSTESFMNAGSGKTGIVYTYIIASHSAKIQLYIDKGDKVWNKKVYDYFFSNKVEIEKIIGTSLIWDRLENNRASIIRYPFEGIGLQEKEEWAKLQEDMIATMIKFEKAFQTYIMNVE